MATSAALAYDSMAGSIQARHLQTSIADATWVESTEDAHAAAQRLRLAGFDQAPVRDDGGALEGYALTAELSGCAGATADAAMHRLDESVLISAHGSVLDVMEAFVAGAGLLFVVDGHRVTGFVTPSDLNKHPARAHFYLLFAELEIALVSVIRELFPDQETAVALLGTEDQKKIRRRYQRDARNDVEVDLAAGMDLGHLLGIGMHDRRLRARFGKADDARWLTWRSKLPEVRNAVAHPVMPFLKPERQVRELMTIESDVLALLGRVGAT